jgi:hypothetical protein
LVCERWAEVLPALGKIAPHALSVITKAVAVEGIA